MDGDLPRIIMDRRHNKPPSQHHDKLQVVPYGGQADEKANPTIIYMPVILVSDLKSASEAVSSITSSINSSPLQANRTSWNGNPLRQLLPPAKPVASQSGMTGSNRKADSTNKPIKGTTRPKSLAKPNNTTEGATYGYMKDNKFFAVEHPGQSGGKKPLRNSIAMGHAPVPVCELKTPPSARNIPRSPDPRVLEVMDRPRVGFGEHRKSKPPKIDTEIQPKSDGKSRTPYPPSNMGFPIRFPTSFPTRDFDSRVTRKTTARAIPVDPTKTLLDRVTILNAFRKFDIELKKSEQFDQRRPLRMIILGGGLAVTHFRSRPRTVAVDILLDPGISENSVPYVDRCIRNIADELDLESNWINREHEKSFSDKALEKMFNDLTRKKSTDIMIFSGAFLQVSAINIHTAFEMKLQRIQQEMNDHRTMNPTVKHLNRNLIIHLSDAVAFLWHVTNRGTDPLATNDCQGTSCGLTRREPIKIWTFRMVEKRFEKCYPGAMGIQDVLQVKNTTFKQVRSAWRSALPARLQRTVG